MRTRAQTKRIEANKTSRKLKSHPATTIIKEYNGPKRYKIAKLRQFTADLQTVGEQQAMLRGAADAKAVFYKIKSKNYIMKHEIAELQKTRCDDSSTLFNRNKQYYANMKSFEKCAYSKGAAMYKTMMFRNLMKNKFLQLEKEDLVLLVNKKNNL